MELNNVKQISMTQASKQTNRQTVSEDSMEGNEVEDSNTKLQRQDHFSALKTTTSSKNDSSFGQNSQLFHCFVNSPIFFSLMLLCFGRVCQIQ